MHIIDRLVEIQKKRGLTDGQMAQMLGYTYRTGWANQKSQRKDTPELEARALKAFPELNGWMARLKNIWLFGKQ